MLNWRRIVGLEKQAGDNDTGPDFPGSSGDRERGKFRESVHSRLTAVAVVNDDGKPVAASTDALLAELIEEVKLMRHALVLGGMAEDIEETIQ